MQSVTPMTKYIPNRSKYAPLAAYLAGRSYGQQQLTFPEIERILGFRLPPSARRYPAWWSNTDGSTTHPWATLWLNAGWKVAGLNLAASKVTFLRISAPRGRTTTPTTRPLLPAVVRLRPEEAQQISP